MTIEFSVGDKVIHDGQETRILDIEGGMAHIQYAENEIQIWVKLSSLSEA